MTTSPPPSEPFTLVGRERELAVLHQRLDAALAGRGSLVLIGGEAGIGKTALSEVLCSEAMEQGVIVLVGRCYDLTETSPYGPWVELFGHYEQTNMLPPLPAAFAQRGTVGDVASQNALFRQTLDFLTALATVRPTLLLLDDLHWADPASFDLIRFLARNLAPLSLVVLVTYRTEELRRDHPLSALLPLLVREARAERLDIGRLSVEAVRALLRTRYGPDAGGEDRLVAYLAGHAEGNPLFIGEVLRMLEERGLLRDGGQCLDDPEGVGVPPLLQHVIDRRVARLGEEVVQLLGVAAVIGHAVPLDLWMTVAETNEEALLAAVAQIEAARVMDEIGDGTGVTFTHALIREAIYEGVRPSQRRRWHRRVGEALEATPRPDPDAMASHYRRAGDARATAWLIMAGERAARTYAWKTAADRFEEALALMERDGADTGDRGWLLFRLGSYRLWTDPASCIAYLAEAERCAVIIGDRALAASALFARGHILCINGDFNQGLRDMGNGVDARRGLTAPERTHLGERGLAEDIRDRADGQGKLIQWLATAGRFREARLVGERARAELGATVRVGTSHDPSLTDTDYGLAQAYAGLGLVDEALRAYRETRRAYRAVGNTPMIGVTAQNEFRWTAAYRADRPAELHHILAEADEAWTQATESVSDYQRRYPSILRLMLDGQWPEFRRQLLTGVNAGHQPLVRQWLGPIARAQGDTALAWDFVHAGLPEGPATEPGSVGFLTAVALLRVAAGLALDAGELDDAKAWLEAHDRWMRWSESPLGRADGGLLWAAYYRASGDAVVASRHADQALEQASDPRQPLALLGAHRLLGELATDAGRSDAAQTHLAAALTLTDACALPFERALVLLAWAALHAATGEYSDALALLDEVRALCLPLGVAPTLASVDVLGARIARATAPRRDYPAGLSSREVEVLRLIAAGRTNREIADALFLSPATVNIHVTHILAKTDTANRAAAAAFALRHGLA